MPLHPTTKQMYDEAHFEYRPTTEDFGEMRFDDDTKGNPRQYRIDQMYRTRHIDADYIIYNQTVISSDFPGNERTNSEVIGTHDEPRFQKQFDVASGRPRPIAVSGNVLKHDIPATKENIQSILNGMVLPATAHVYKKKPGDRVDIIPHNTNFVLVNGNAKYGGFTQDEFMNRHFDDLLYKAVNGYYPTQAKPFGEQVKEKQQQETTTQVKEKEAREKAITRIEQPKKDTLITKEEKRESRASIYEPVESNKGIVESSLTLRSTVEEEQEQEKPKANKRSPKQNKRV